MNTRLPPDSLNDIRRNICSSLSDTFLMMFQMDVRLLPSLPSANDEPMISSFMELSCKKSTGSLTVSVNRSLVEFLARRLDSSVEVPSPAIVQDIVCEINNIVANHLRTYIYNKIDIQLNLSLPKGGFPPQIDQEATAIHLDFRIRERDVVTFGFCYPEELRQAVG